MCPRSSSVDDEGLATGTVPVDLVELDYSVSFSGRWSRPLQQGIA